MAESMSAIDILAYKFFFKTIDKDGDGKIDINEFTELLQDLDYCQTRDEARDIFDGSDKDGDNRIDFEECMKTIKNPHSVDDIFASKFKKMDWDGDQKLSSSQLQFGLMGMSKFFKSEKIADLIKEVDTNNDGQVDYKEFLTLLPKIFD